MRRTGQRALVCAYHTPQADRDSGSRRILHLVDFLQKAGWDVSFLASDGAGDARDVRALEQRAVAVYDGLRDRVDTLFSTARFDLALIAFWSNAERYLRVIRASSPTTRVIVDSVDLHFLREARYVFHGRRDRADPNLLDAKYASRFIREMNTYAAADGVLTVSPKEAGMIGDLTGDANLAFAVPDCEAIAPSTVPFGERRGILSLGSFQHPPNVQAVEYLCTEILPRLDPAMLAAHPVYVVGNCLNETVRAYCHGLPHVRMVGWVPSVEPYFEQTRISVVPLLYGAGTKRKMIQSLMTGTPAVSTSIGIEGLNLRHGEHVLVADDPKTFAASIARLLTDAKLWRRIARAGRSHIAEAHSPAAAQSLLMAAIADVLSRDAKGPAAVIDPKQPQPHIAKQQYHQQLVPRIRQAVAESVPPGATVLVVSKGDAELLNLNGARAWHFPQREGGIYAGHHPAHSADAIAHLEALRDKGGEFLVFPSTAFWWLEHYDGFKRHLENRYRQVARETDSCIIYELRRAVAEPERESRSVAAREEPPDVKLIALYLPQFHPIPENDAWWGEGFTEWRNVAKAEPLFPGHYQPHIPADLGFYDLRLVETRHAQADMARAYGIHGFCYYHYWFNGKLLLERPFAEVLASGAPDFPFCLCWANDPWSRRWNGREDDLLQAQTYSPKDDVKHIRWLLPALRDPRAIRIDGKPLFLVYRAQHLPDPARTTDTWRREVLKAGLSGIYLVAMETAWDLGWDATTVGFDAKVLFQPQFGKLMTSVPRIPIAGKDHLQVYDYQEAWRVLGRLDPVAYKRYDCVCPGWDNSPRVGDTAIVLHDSTPAAYEDLLRQAIERARTAPPDQRVVFINAWNEWAEGCHLEPDARHGAGYLEATRRALTREPATGTVGRVPMDMAASFDVSRGRGHERLTQLRPQPNTSRSISIYTGLPGSGKSSRLVEDVNEALAQGRPVLTFLCSDFPWLTGYQPYIEERRLASRRPGLTCPLNHFVSTARCADILQGTPAGTLIAIEEAQGFGSTIMKDCIDASRRGLDLILVSPSADQSQQLNGYDHTVRVFAITCQRCATADAETVVIPPESDATLSLCATCFDEMTEEARQDLLQRLRQELPHPGKEAIYQPVELPECAHWPVSRPDCESRAEVMMEAIRDIGLLSDAELRHPTYLDIGCNSGYFCDYVQRLGFYAKGIDAVQNNITIARLLDSFFRREQRANKKFVTYEAVDAYEYLRRTQDEMFDVVSSFSVFQWIMLQKSVDHGIACIEWFFAKAKRLCVLEMGYTEEETYRDKLTITIDRDWVLNLMKESGNFAKVSVVSGGTHGLVRDLFLGIKPA